MRRATLAVRGVAQQVPGADEILTRVSLTFGGVVFFMTLEEAEQLRGSLAMAAVDAVAAREALSLNPVLAAAVPAGSA